MKKGTQIAVIAVLALSATACSNSDTDPGLGGVIADSAFPGGLTLASPLETEPAGGILARSALSATHRSIYSATTATIDGLLDGSTPVNDTFNPMLFLRSTGDAACFGPAMNYQDHPDGVTPNSGQLPSGDLGLWAEHNDDDGNGVYDGQACAAAQLNARLRGTGGRVMMALMSLASSARTAVDAGGSLPSGSGGSLDVTAEMNALMLPNVNFTAASIVLDTSGAADEWRYTLDFVYTSTNPMDSSTFDHVINLSLVHQPGSSSTQYEGLLNYRVTNNQQTGGNCDRSVVTINGSVHYRRSSASAITLQAREAEFCGDGVNGITAALPGSGTLSGNVVDPALKYNANGDDPGWANNFTLVTASYDPSSLAGSYSTVWQAGDADSNARVMNVGLSDTTPLEGEAYYGFGDPVDVSDGSITGFYCNWAGPGASGTLHTDRAQRQSVVFDTTAGIFKVPTGGSDIVYAPVNSCSYDGSGTFLYDRDLDGDLTDESADTASVSDPVSFTLQLDLMGLNGAADIAEAIQNQGYAAPVYP